MRLAAGTLYAALDRLTAAGLVRAEHEEIVNGRARRYRRLLRAYPAGYRHRRGDELLATLLEATAPGQRYPTLRETLGLLGGGLSVRAGVAGECTPWMLWAEGLRLGTLLLLVSLTGDAAGGRAVRDPSPTDRFCPRPA